MNDGKDRTMRIAGREEDGPILQLDPLGDTIMVITDRSRHTSRSFLVSSRILSLASPVFTVMFKPDAREMRQTVRLDDDPETMGWMLSILHHQCADVPLSIHPRVLARLAIHCDKYDCCMALRAWSSHWCNMLQSPNTPEDIGHILLAAYMLRAPNLAGIAAQAAKQLAPDFQAAWKGHEILKLLPEAFPGLRSPASPLPLAGTRTLTQRQRGWPSTWRASWWRSRRSCRTPRTACGSSGGPLR